MSKEKKTKRRAFTEADFNQIRLLLDAGLTDRQVMVATGRSHFVVANIHGKKTKNYSDGLKTYGEYRSFLSNFSKKYFFNKEETQETNQPEQTPQVDEQVKKTPTGKDVIELLKSIDNHLKDLVDLKRSAIEYAKTHKRGPFFNKFLS